MRCQVSRQTLRALNRTRQRGSGMQQAECAKRSLVSVTSLPPVYKNPTPPPPLKELKSGDQGFMSKLWSRYSIGGQQSRIHRAESLLQAAQVQSQDPRWYGPGRVSRDFRPRHALLTMHLWFLHKRLVADTYDKQTALLVQEELFNALWDDTACRIRQQGINELLLNKNLKKVQQYTFMHLTHYDHAFTEFAEKPEERMEELRKIVWMHILVRDDAIDERVDQIDRIAWYIEANYQNIFLDWPDEYYRQARVKWVDLPDFSGLMDTDGKELPENPIHPDDILPHPWRRNITLKGVEYYWNPETRKTQWERPTAATTN